MTWGNTKGDSKGDFWLVCGRYGDQYSLGITSSPYQAGTNAANIHYIASSESISTNVQYVTLHWKSGIRFFSRIQWINPLETLENPTPFWALEQSNQQSQIMFIDCSLFLIGMLWIFFIHYCSAGSQTEHRCRCSYYLKSLPSMYWCEAGDKCLRSYHHVWRFFDTSSSLYTWVPAASYPPNTYWYLIPTRHTTRKKLSFGRSRVLFPRAQKTWLQTNLVVRFFSLIILQRRRMLIPPRCSSPRRRWLESREIEERQSGSQVN